jgi:ABC-type multidrug transport system ATPase subunit
VIVATDQLSVHFRSARRSVLKALDDVTIHVPAGEFFALLGENGAGKSTAMHCMLGLVHPTSGTVSISGTPPALGAPIFDRIGYLPEEPHWYPSYLTIEEAIRYYARLHRHQVSLDRAWELLDRLGLGEHRSLRIGKCSKGMKQKVGIAQCLLGEPELLFLDEPMRGLDPVGVRDFREMLVEMNRRGTTIIMNSHILAEVESVATNVAILKKGKLVLQDRVANLVREDVTRYEVELEAETLPAYFAETGRHDGIVHGTVAAEALHELVLAARDGQLRLHSCRLRKPTLEESFFAAIDRENAHA